MTSTTTRAERVQEYLDRLDRHEPEADAVIENEHFARDLDAFEEIDARDDDRPFPWFIRNPWMVTTLILAIVALALVGLTYI